MLVLLGTKPLLFTLYALSPTQVRIASHITRPPDDNANGGIKPPEVARIRDDNVVIERISSRLDKVVEPLQAGNQFFRY